MKNYITGLIIGCLFVAFSTGWLVINSQKIAWGCKYFNSEIYLIRAGLFIPKGSLYCDWQYNF